MIRFRPALGAKEGSTHQESILSRSSKSSELCWSQLRPALINTKIYLRCDWSSSSSSVLKSHNSKWTDERGGMAEPLIIRLKISEHRQAIQRKYFGIFVVSCCFKVSFTGNFTDTEDKILILPENDSATFQYYSSIGLNPDSWFRYCLL